MIQITRESESAEYKTFVLIDDALPDIEKARSHMMRWSFIVVHGPASRAASSDAVGGGSLLQRSVRFLACWRPIVQALAGVDPVTVHVDGGAENVDFRRERLGANAAFRCPQQVLVVQAARHALGLVVAEWAPEQRVQLLHAVLVLCVPCRLALPHGFWFLDRAVEDTKLD